MHIVRHILKISKEQYRALDWVELDAVKQMSPEKQGGKTHNS